VEARPNIIAGIRKQISSRELLGKDRLVDQKERPSAKKYLQPYRGQLYRQ
jgi:hypothetical protein